jgi:hypothetical protein
MADQTKSSQSKSGSNVPAGWLALILGTLLGTLWLVMGFAAMIGLTNAKPPAFLYPTAVALVVCGYIACIALPRIHKRVDELEQRVDALASQTLEHNKPGDEP